MTYFSKGISPLANGKHHGGTCWPLSCPCFPWSLSRIDELTCTGQTWEGHLYTIWTLHIDRATLVLQHANAAAFTRNTRAQTERVPHTPRARPPALAYSHVSRACCARSQTPTMVLRRRLPLQSRCNRHSKITLSQCSLCTTPRPRHPPTHERTGRTAPKLRHLPRSWETSRSRSHHARRRRRPPLRVEPSLLLQTTQVDWQE